MSKTLRIVATAAVTLGLALPVFAADRLTADSVVATVNGTDITLGHMLSVRSGLPEQYQQLPDTVLWDGILDQLIQQEVLAQDELAQETRSVKVALDNERRSLLASEVISRVADMAVTKEDIEKAYQDTYLTGAKGQEYNASHILVESKEEAEAIALQLRGGAEFAEMAREKSTGPSGPNGGALGWFSAGMMVAPFQTAVESLKPGEVSGPVETQFGWHVIKLNETRIQEAPDLAEVRGEIEVKLQQEAVEAKVDSLVSSAKVTRTNKADVDASVLSKIELLEE
ncbi:MAG: peptidylprolyl isomerase [Pelagimonas sp.]